MEKIQADLAVQQFIDFIGICVNSDSLPLEMKQQLGDMANKALDYQAESRSLTSGSQAASPSESSMPSCTENTNSKANKGTDPTVIVAAVNNELSVCEHSRSSSGNSSRDGNKDASGHGPDSIPLLTSTVCPDSEACSKTVSKESVENESKNSNCSAARTFIKSVNGSGATSSNSDVEAVEAREATDLALPQSGQEQIQPAYPSGSYSSVQVRLLSASSVTRRMETESQVKHFLGEEPLGRIDAFAGPGMYVPAMQRVVGAQYFLPHAPSTSIDGQGRHGQNPFPFPGGQGDSCQGDFYHTMSTPPMAPMAYVGPFGYPAHGYGQVPFGPPGVTAASSAPSRVPLGNSRSLNVEAGEGPRANGAGPQRSGRKKAKDTGIAAAPYEAKPSLRCNLQGCPNPDKEFYSMRELRRHQNSTKAHSKSTFLCPICLKSLSRDDARQRHIANVHSK